MLHYYVEQGLSLKGYPDAERISNEDLLRLKVDVLIPAAIGGVIDEKNAEHIQAPIVIEAANAPVTPEADDILHARGILVLPDILANAGGVTVSYFEWVQNMQYYKWNLTRVRQELDAYLSRAFEEVWQEAHERKISLRNAAYLLAIRRVHGAAERAGLT
jgi:glutamate dehydrogenase (NAD(P)+)